MKLLKSIICVLLTVCLFFTPAFAEDWYIDETGIVDNGNMIQPQWEDTSSATCHLTFVGRAGSATASISGNPGTTSISGTLTVYRLDGNRWTYVDSSSGTLATVDAWGAAVNFTGEEGRVYQAKLTAYVYRSETPEYVTLYENKIC